MSKKRFFIIAGTALAVLLALILWYTISNIGLKTVDNEYLHTLPGSWDATKDFSEGLAAVKVEGKWGYINTEGTMVIEAIYDGANRFSEGLAAVSKNGRWGYIDKNGETVIAFQYESTYAFSEGLAVYSEGLYYGYIDKTGNKVTPAIYSEASSFSGGVACVKKDSSYGFLNQAGAAITEFSYGISAKASEGLIAVFSDAGLESLKTGYIDTDGRVVLEPTWYDARSFSQGLAAVQAEAFTSPWNYIDKTGTVVIKGEWDEAEGFSQDRAVVHDKTGYYFIDLTGAKASNAYAKAFSFTAGGLARVAVANTVGWSFGFINSAGEEVIALKYSNARDYHNGAAAVAQNGDWAFVSADGTEMCDFLWDDAGDFTEDGIARVRNGEYYGFVKLK